ncbi:60S ribosomal protein L13 [Gracilaria domingensis]|nr:60S ribosomal protein L13 [Gracilaria domingensis]
MRKRRRRRARTIKAAKLAPRPIDGPLRPIVNCTTNKYNMRVRLGRGFSVEELKEAGIPFKFAPTIGIAVDPRRKNRSVDAMQENVQRLKEYKSKLILFPKNPAKPKAGEATKEDLAVVAQLKGKLMPIPPKSSSIEVRPITNDDRAKYAYRSLRIERTNQKYDGIRKQRAAQKAAEEAEKAKK